METSRLARARPPRRGAEPPGEWNVLSAVRESDAQLLARAAHGDRTASAMVFGRFFGRLWSLAYLLLHDARAADAAVQETYASALDEVGKVAAAQDPAAWFCSLALAACRRIARTGEARPERTGGHGPVSIVLRREASQQLAVALGFLTEIQREVFVLRYVEGLPYREIAAILQMTPGGVRVLGHQARGALRARLGRDPVPEAGG